MDLGLDDKRAIVLASSRGIGLASAKALLREGARVIISSSNDEHLADAIDSIEKNPKIRTDQYESMILDLADSDSVPNRIEEMIDHLGGLDILVTNTGGPPKIGFEEATIEQFDEYYILILRSIIQAVAAALPALRESSGAITNLIAVSATEPEPNHILGNTFRPGIYGFSKTLAREYAADGVRVNCVCPKKVGVLTEHEVQRKTHIDDYAAEHDLPYAEARERFIAEIIPLGKEGDLDDFGKAVAFISSDVASHITGENLNVDGGWSVSAF